MKGALEILLADVEVDCRAEKRWRKKAKVKRG